MRSSLLNNLCNDNNIENLLFFFHFYKFCGSCYKTSKNNLVKILTGGCPLQNFCNCVSKRTIHYHIKQLAMNHHKF